MKFLESLLVFLITILILLLPFGQLARVPLANPQIGLYLFDFLIVALWGVLFLKKIIYKEKIFPSKLFQFILGFVCFACFSLILALPRFSLAEILIASFYLLRWAAYTGIYFSLVDLKNNQRLEGFFINLLIFSGMIFALLGLGQYIFFPDLRPLTSAGWDPHFYRVASTFFDPSFAGMVYVFVMALILSVHWEKLKKICFESFIIYHLSFIIIYLAFALTYSRSSYLAGLVAVAIISRIKKSKKFFIFYFLFFIFTLVVLPRPSGEGVRLERESTIKSRIKNWGQTAKIAFDNPLFGVGFNTYRFVQRDYGFLKEWQETHAGAGSDSSLLFVLATTGLAGLISYLILIKEILYFAWKNLDKSKVSLAVFVSFSAFLVHSFFNNSLFYAFLMIWMWLLLALEEFQGT